MKYQAKPGDIIKINFNPQAGHEQQGRRPAVVVSNAFFNKLSSIAIVCPITNTKSNFPLNVPLNEETNTTGSVLCQHVKSLDLVARNVEFIEKIPEAIFTEVKDIIISEIE